MKPAIPALLMSVLALSTTAALAEEVNHAAPWAHVPVYEVKHPAAATCGEIVDAAPTRQSHLVAWLEGMSHGKDGTAVNPDTYQPVEVPSVIEECRSTPDALVQEIVQKHHHGLK